MKFRYSPQAENDIEEISNFIAQDNYRAAMNWIDAIEQKCDRLVDMPKLGISLGNARQNARMISMGKYIILYRETKTGIEIARVVHGARQWQDLL